MKPTATTEAKEETIDAKVGDQIGDEPIISFITAKDGVEVDMPPVAVEMPTVFVGQQVRV